MGDQAVEELDRGAHLHGRTRSASAEAEDCAELHLRAGLVPDHWKEYVDPHKTQ